MYEVCLGVAVTRGNIYLALRENRHYPKHITYIILFDFHKQLCEIGPTIFSFTDEESQVRRGKVTCITSQRWQEVEPALETRQLALHPHNNPTEVPGAQGVYGNLSNTSTQSQELDQNRSLSIPKSLFFYYTIIVSLQIVGCFEYCSFLITLKIFTLCSSFI